MRSHAWAPTTARCTTSRHARPRGSRRPCGSLWVPSAWLRPWWTLRSPFRRRPVLTGRWGPPNAPKPSFLHSMMTHVGWCSGFGLSEHPYGCLGLVVKDLGPLEHFLKKSFLAHPFFTFFLRNHATGPGQCLDLTAKVTWRSFSVEGIPMDVHGHRGPLGSSHGRRVARAVLCTGPAQPLMYACAQHSASHPAPMRAS